MSKDAYYFSHDSNARHDPKILALRNDHGIAGYGIYWVVVEMLREQEEFKLPKKNYVFNAIAMQVQSKDFTKDNAKKFVEDCINEYDLLQNDDDYFWSNSLLKRMEKKNDLSEKRREAAKARWKKSDEINVSNDVDEQNNASAMQNNANAEQTHAIKGKEIKEKKEKKVKNNKNNYAEFVTMTIEEYQKLVDEHGEVKVQQMIKILDDYKGSSGKNYKSDYRAILSWVVEKVKQQPFGPPGRGKQIGQNGKNIRETTYKGLGENNNRQYEPIELTDDIL